MQCNWRVHRDRQTVKKLSNMLKMRRLARFWLDMCVTKCYLRWCKFAVTSREEKKVLRKVVHRMMYKGVLQAFNKLADHAEEQRFKRPAAQKVLGFLSSHKDGARNEMWDRWRDAVDETRETHRRAAERLLGFAVNSSLAARAAAFSGWREFVARKRRALFRWRNSALVRVWALLTDYISTEAHNRRILERVRRRWLLWSVVVGIQRWAVAAEALRWARQLLVHEIWRYSMRKLAQPFDLLFRYARFRSLAREILGRPRARLVLCVRVLRAMRAHVSQKRETMRRVRRLLLGAVAEAFDAMRELVRERRLAEREAYAGGSAAVRRWLMRPAAQALQAWSETVKQQKSWRAKVTGPVGSEAPCAGRVGEGGGWRDGSYISSMSVVVARERGGGCIFAVKGNDIPTSQQQPNARLYCVFGGGVGGDGVGWGGGWGRWGGACTGCATLPWWPPTRGGGRRWG